MAETEKEKALLEKAINSKPKSLSEEDKKVIDDLKAKYGPKK